MKKAKKRTTRFVAVSGYEGVRKDTITEKYQARKTIHGKTYTKLCDTAYQASQWRLNFHPLLTDVEIKKNVDVNEEIKLKKSKEIIQTKYNGSVHRYTFEKAWRLYDKYHLSEELEPQSRNDRLKIAKHFFPDLMKFKMVELTSELIDSFMDKQVKKAIEVTKNPRRKNFDNDLKVLKAFCNWYRENYDGQFVCPILKRHHSVGTLKKRPKGKKPKMNPAQVASFFNALGREENSVWRDFAELHFFLCGRVQEPAGLQWPCVDFDTGEILVRDVAIWGESKKFLRLKEYPKNEKERVVRMSDRVREILKRRLQDVSQTPCRHFRELDEGKKGERLSFVFHLEGEPLSYRAIQYRYNKALQRAGLSDQFSATHILRGAAANIIEKNLGRDEAQNGGGWNSRETMEKHYLDSRREMSQAAADCLQKVVVGESFDPHVETSQVTKEKFKLTLVKS